MPTDAFDRTPVTYQEAIKEALLLSDRLILELVRRASRNLRELEQTAPSAHQRAQAKHALGQLVKQESVLCERFYYLLQQALTNFHANQGAGAPAKEGDDAATRVENLRLMDDSAVNAAVELARVQHFAKQAVDGQQAELDALICSAQGFRVARAEQNPLRPELYVKALRDAVEHATPTPDMRAQWVHHMAEPLGAELGTFYAQLIAALKRNGLKPASLVAVPQPSAAERRLYGRNEQFLHSLVTEIPYLDSQMNGIDKRPSAAEMDTPTIAEDNENSSNFERGRGFPHPAQDLAPATRKPASPAPELAGSKQQVEARASQAVARQVVKLMLENLASNMHLLPPVQQAVRALTEPLYKLVATDPRFFSYKKHPVRLFLDQITQRSLGYKSVDSEGFASFFEPLWRFVSELQKLDSIDAHTFKQAMTELDQAWNRQGGGNARVSNDRSTAISTLLYAEQRHFLAQDIAHELSQKPGMTEIDDEIRDFLCGPWAQVIAQARIKAPDTPTDTKADPGGYEAWVDQVLWSAQPALTHLDPERLVRLVPEVLPVFRQGIKSIGFPAAQGQAFVDRLFALHRLGLRKNAGEPAPSPIKSNMPPDRKPATPPSLWMTPKEASTSSFLDTPVETLRAIEFEGSTQADAASSDDLDLINQVAVVGAWFDFQENDQWSRIRLSWISPHATLFMFSDARGNTFSITRRMFENLMETEKLRWISSSTMVHGTLDAVTQEAVLKDLRPPPG